MVVIEKKIKASSKELKTLVIARGSHLMDLTGVGPVVAARILADVGDVARFTDRNRFASWTGTAPLDASSGRADPTPALARREPQGQPRHPHRRRQPDPPRQSRPGLLPAQARRRQDPAWKPCAASRGASPTPCIDNSRRRRTPPPRRGRGSGRAPRGVSSIQRGRLAPAHRHFGSATSRTRTNDATRARHATEDRHSENPPTHPLTSEGCRCDARRQGRVTQPVTCSRASVCGRHVRMFSTGQATFSLTRLSVVCAVAPDARESRARGIASRIQHQVEYLVDLNEAKRMPRGVACHHADGAVTRVLTGAGTRRAASHWARHHRPT